jgi:pantoate--beta-alanine ligase
VITVHTVARLRAELRRIRGAGQRAALVPTMGYLHEGHLQLCDVAREHAHAVVMSIFVNPLQFGAGEDLDRYPRDVARDARLAADRGVDVLFTPATAEMYPDGDARVRVHAPSLEDRLCGRHRPGHFEGVLTVVAKLLNLIQPDVAVFGRKDLQQAVLIRRLARDLDFAVDIVIAPIIREPDGLAMSSRNIFLSPDQRVAARALHRALLAAQQAFTDGEMEPRRLVAAASAILDAEPGVSPQYVELVEPELLETPSRAAAGHVVAIAAHVGSTRLIDNHILS